MLKNGPFGGRFVQGTFAPRAGLPGVKTPAAIACPVSRPTGRDTSYTLAVVLACSVFMPTAFGVWSLCVMERHAAPRTATLRLAAPAVLEGQGADRDLWGHRREGNVILPLYEKLVDNRQINSCMMSLFPLPLRREDPKRVVNLQVDGETPWWRVQPVMETISIAGYEAVRLTMIRR